MTTDAKPERVEMKPCPFCGGPATTMRYNGTLQATCAAAHVECAGSDVLAPVEMWNRRAEPQWQPIETAPRDGTRVLLWVPTAIPNCGCDAIGEWHDDCDDEDGWFGDDGEYLGEPTFWRPLDAPPVTK